MITPTAMPSVVPKKQSMGVSGKLTSVQPNLCVYGPASTGKTSLVAALLLAGIPVTLIDIDGNINPLMDLPQEALALLNYIRVSTSNVKPAFLPFIKKLTDTGTAVVCNEHGMVDCLECKNLGGDLVGLNLNKLSGRVLVFDNTSRMTETMSFEAMKQGELKAGEKFSYTEHGTATLLTKFFGNCWLPLNIPTITIAHPLDTQSTLDPKGPPPFHHPLLGTRPTTLTMVTKFGYVWYVPYTPATTKHNVHFESTSTHFATSRNRAGQFKGKSLDEAVVQLFSSLKKEV